MEGEEASEEDMDGDGEEVEAMEWGEEVEGFMDDEDDPLTLGSRTWITWTPLHLEHLPAAMMQMAICWHPSSHSLIETTPFPSLPNNHVVVLFAIVKFIFLMREINRRDLIELDHSFHQILTLTVDHTIWEGKMIMWFQERILRIKIVRSVTIKVEECVSFQF